MRFISIIISLFLLSCSSKFTTEKPNGEINLKTNSWYFNDLEKDSIPGISLNKAHQFLNSLKISKGANVVVAIIDTEIDIKHEDLKNKIWINPHEIPNNQIDDDKNGYIDDINGWNFLGNMNGENVIFSNFETTRIVKKYGPKLSSLKEDKSTGPDHKNMELYRRAKIEYDYQLENSILDYEYILDLDKKYKTAKKALSSYFPEGLYTKEIFYSTIIDTNDNNLGLHYLAIKEMLDYDITQAQIDNQIKSYKNYLDYYLNVDYNERKTVGDNPDDLLDTKYGNPNISGNIQDLYHGTLVAGVLAAERNNGLGIDGIYKNIKLMPLAISSNGDEHDKDIALAIRYAVDNGAKIINMSSSKEFSMHEEWVKEALEYAYNNDVLFIRSVSNSNINIDLEDNYCYPEKDYNYNYPKVFISVAGSTNNLENLKASFSSYGKNSVDIFAPAVDINTTAVNNKYINDDGNSLAAPIVSRIAALIKSYYPDYAASKIKEILLKSGTTYQVDVKINQEDGTNKIVPFSELSKSGKVVNAYNALLMAEQLSKRN